MKAFQKMAQYEYRKITGGKDQDPDKAQQPDKKLGVIHGRDKLRCRNHHGYDKSKDKQAGEPV